MSGYSSSIIMDDLNPQFLDIVIENSQYRIESDRWRPWQLTADEIKKFTDGVLDVFGKLEKAFKQSVKDNKGGTLDKDFCHQQLMELAKWGSRAYQQFFDADARFVLTQNITGIQQMGVSVSPTFHSNLMLLPWEVLYEGGDYHDGDPDLFWGFRYIPGRILTPGKGPFQHICLQRLPSHMLFCLNHKLRFAHAQEWPEIQKMVKANQQDQCNLLYAASCQAQDEPNIPLNERLLKHLYQSNYNMLHFACHCKQGKEGADALIISLLGGEQITDSEKTVELSTYTFLDVKGEFQYSPLVFLNACESGGAAYTIFNLPQVFTVAKAAAIIATACPVPDVFAAAFARVFYEFFLKQRLSIGEALRQSRLHFLQEHNNPLGLAYGLYTPAHYRLEQAPKVGVKAS
jgi:hypothetical protein